MKVLDARVSTNLSTYRPHRLQILVDDWPKKEERTYERKFAAGGSFFFFEKDGYIDFSFHSPTNEHGYGGAVFEYNIGTLEEPVLVKVKGPWSSNPDSIMRLWPQYEIVDVSYTADPTVMERGYTFYAGQVTKEIVDQAIAIMRERGENWVVTKEPIFPRVESYRAALEERGLTPVAWEISRPDCPTVKEPSTREDRLCSDSWHLYKEGQI